MLVMVGEDDILGVEVIVMVVTVIVCQTILLVSEVVNFVVESNCYG